ncbi:unnamed protein product [Paramecium octaurelia]|uniref:Uncharacterized protein n=1 Tax=Paramecium octaurelia TaxID=43137 RepID=A0A8S1UM56_PAROT|nr:unnamed protein product [Paramecium octaurelia]
MKILLEKSEILVIAKKHCKNQRNQILQQIIDMAIQVKDYFNKIDKFVDNLPKEVYNSKAKAFFSQMVIILLQSSNIIDVMNSKISSYKNAYNQTRKINQGQIFYSNQSIQNFDSISSQQVKEMKIDFQAIQSEFSQNQKYLALVHSISMQTVALGVESNVSSIAEITKKKRPFLLIEDQNELDFINSIALRKVEQSEQICKINEEVKVLKVLFRQNQIFRRSFG